MARTSTPAPHVARSAADAATTPAPAPVAPAAGDGPAVAVLAALSAEPGGGTVAVIAARAGISTAAVRQALLAHEKNGTATRVECSRPGFADTWTPAAPEAPRDEAPPAETLGAGSSPDGGWPSDEPADGTADVGQPAPVPADGTAEGGEAEVGTTPGPDSAVTAEAAGTVLAIAKAADEADKALAAGDLDAALEHLDVVQEQAAYGRWAVKAAASGRRAPATRPGALRDLVEDHLRKFPDAAFTPHQVGKVLTRDGCRAEQLRGAGVAAVVGDIRVPADAAAAARGCTTVISAIHGFTGGRRSSPATIDRDGNRTLIQAALDAGAGHLILVSVHSAAPRHPMSLHRMKYAAEQALIASGLPWTIIRPSAFLETWVGLIGAHLADRGKALVFGPGDNPINFVPVDTVATMIAQAVHDQALRGRILDVTGPGNLTFCDIARQLIAASTTPGKITHIPLAALRLASVLAKLVSPAFARQAQAAVVMNTTDMAIGDGR